MKENPYYGAGLNTQVDRPERIVDGKRIAASMLTTLVVRPPIRVGESFNAAALGRNSRDVALTEIVSNNELTSLAIEAWGASDRERMDRTALVAHRVGRLVNNPEQAVVMMDEDPFAAGTLGVEDEPSQRSM
jgi:hypothetical protein